MSKRRLRRVIERLNIGLEVIAWRNRFSSSIPVGQGERADRWLYGGHLMVACRSFC